MPARLALWVIVARGFHPFPFRTRKLSLSAPMVLRARVRGRVGRRPINLNKKPTVNRWAFCIYALCAESHRYGEERKSLLARVRTSARKRAARTGQLSKESGE